MKFKNFYLSLLAYLQYAIPQHALSKLIGIIANSESYWIKTIFIRIFMTLYPINMKEAEYSDPQVYRSFNHFFTRRLKKGVRNFDSQSHTLISPVDGIIEQVGILSTPTQVKAKKSYFELVPLLGNNQTLAEYFAQGSFITLYLAPQDYHRVHMPIRGKLLEMTYVPGCLFSVNHNSTQHIANLFSRNERVICIFETEQGKMALILVGALIVGSIHTKWHGQVAPATKQGSTTWNYAKENILLEKGVEMGHFQMGSTVIMVFPDKTVVWNNNLDKKHIQLGELLGKITTHSMTIPANAVL